MRTEEGAAAGLSWPGLGGGDMRVACGVSGMLKVKEGVGLSMAIGKKRSFDCGSSKCCSPSAADHWCKKDGSVFHTKAELEARGLV
jgi:hypothetical protein